MYLSKNMFLNKFSENFKLNWLFLKPEQEKRDNSSKNKAKFISFLLFYLVFEIK